MLYDYLLTFATPVQAVSCAAIITFVLTFITLNMKFSFLPRDKGREFAINGALSRGKLRGVGLVFVVDFILASILFVPLSMEYIIYLILLIMKKSMII